MTHQIRHPNLQIHSQLAFKYRRMANAARSRAAPKDEAAMKIVDSLNDFADEHQRKAKVFGPKRDKFIFIR